MTIVMATKDNTPSMQSRSATTPTRGESTTPVSQPSGLGELTVSTVTKTDKRGEAIQKAQVGSLMEADKNKEPQEKTSKRQSPTLATRPKKYALQLWVEIETSVGMYSTPRKTLIVLILQLMLSTSPIQAVPACTWVWSYVGLLRQED